MNDIVHQLYEHGDTAQLIATARGAGTFTDDRTGACQALRLLARLGDTDAIAYCDAAPESCLAARAQ
jgi:hypothetical protein